MNPDIKVVAIQPGPNSLPSDENSKPEEITGVHPFNGVPTERIPSTMDLHIYDTDGKVDIFVAGVGTGGTISGVGALPERIRFRVSVQVLCRKR